MEIIDRDNGKRLSRKLIEEKMEIIRNNDLENIPSTILPETFSIDYYFISYSHKDFRSVYYDIFNLQLEGMNIWYDRGIPAGKDWKEVAQRNITPHECKGIILYVSENSLLSEAVIEEIEYAKDVGKPFVCIVIPFEENETHKGRPLSILEMIDALKASGRLSISKARKLKALFDEKTIFLPLATPVETKVEKIKLATPSTPLLDGKIEQYDIGGEQDFVLSIVSIKDHSISKITKQDFYDLVSFLGESPKKNFTLIFEKTCLANCPFLESIEIGNNFEIFEIGEYAFANDIRFSGFKTKKAIECNIQAGSFFNCSLLRNEFIISFGKLGDNAFYGCTSIKRVIAADADKAIGEYAFSGCSSLTEVFLSDQIESIGKGAFRDCESLEEICLPNGLTKINKGTFAGCSSLRKVDMGDNVTSIEDSAFRGCSKLEEITLSDQLTYIGDGAFRFCHNLQFNQFEGINYLESKKNPYLVAVSIYDRLKRIERLPEECKFLYSDIFRSCNRIATQFTLPKGLLHIGSKAFSRSDSLREIEIPDSITRIEAEAFSGCKRLEKANLGKHVTYIGQEAFADCASLQTLIIPSSVRSMDESALRGCSSLSEITYLGTVEEWKMLYRSIVESSLDRFLFYSEYEHIDVVYCSDGDFYNPGYED